MIKHCWVAPPECPHFGRSGVGPENWNFQMAMLLISWPSSSSCPPSPSLRWHPPHPRRVPSADHCCWTLDMQPCAMHVVKGRAGEAPPPVSPADLSCWESLACPSSAATGLSPCKPPTPPPQPGRCVERRHGRRGKSVPTSSQGHAQPGGAKQREKEVIRRAKPRLKV